MCAVTEIEILEKGHILRLFTGKAPTKIKNLSIMLDSPNLWHFEA